VPVGAVLDFWVVAGADPDVEGAEEVGAVTAGMESEGAVLSPELSPPQPVATRPMASAASGITRR
jgi:hypothetical protein